MDYEKLKQDLQKKLHKEILPTKTLDFSVETLTEKTLTLKAPLQSNINDKGTAFGGSIASLATITGWSVCWLLAHIQKIPCDIVIHKSSMEYARPITKDLIATVHFPCKKSSDELFEKLKRRKKASLELTVVFEESGKKCVEYLGKYVLLVH